MFPTPEADLIFLKADKINKELEQLKELTENMSNRPSGLIRLACAPTLGLDLTPSIVSEFSSLYPGTKFETHAYHFNEMLDHLRDGSVDIGIAFEAKNFELSETHNPAPAGHSTRVHRWGYEWLINLLRFWYNIFVQWNRLRFVLGRG